MIQRIQTVFLLASAVCSILLLFIPVAHINSLGQTYSISLVPLEIQNLQSGPSHLAAIGVNFVSLVLSFVTILIYHRRGLQRRLCYLLIVFWLLISLLISFAPLIHHTKEIFTLEKTVWGPILGVTGMISCYLAARNVKKDIDLLKSADRIR
jgi:hypothetical protein